MRLAAEVPPAVAVLGLAAAGSFGAEGGARWQCPNSKDWAARLPPEEEGDKDKLTAVAAAVSMEVYVDREARTALLDALEAATAACR